LFPARRRVWRQGGSALEGHHVVHLGADADPLADMVVVVRGTWASTCSPLARRSV
jgi:hypothetical protein